MTLLPPLAPWTACLPHLLIEHGRLHKERSVGNKLREGAIEKWKGTWRGAGGGWGEAGGGRACKRMKGSEDKRVWKIPDFRTLNTTETHVSI